MTTPTNLPPLPETYAIPMPGDVEALMSWAHQHGLACAAAARKQALEEAAKEAQSEADIRERAGNTHPEDSPSRGRCFAAARAAINIVHAIRKLGEQE